MDKEIKRINDLEKAKNLKVRVQIYKENSTLFGTSTNTIYKNIIECAYKDAPNAVKSLVKKELLEHLLETQEKELEKTQILINDIEQLKKELENG